MNQVFEEYRTRLSPHSNWFILGPPSQTEPAATGTTFRLPPTGVQRAVRSASWRRTLPLRLNKSKARLPATPTFAHFATQSGQKFARRGFVQAKMRVSARQWLSTKARRPAAGQLDCFAKLEPKRAVTFLGSPSAFPRCSEAATPAAGASAPCYVWFRRDSRATSSLFALRSKVWCREPRRRPATTPIAGAAWSRKDSRATSSLFALRSKVWYSNRVGFRVILENTGVKWDHRVSGPSLLRLRQRTIELLPTLPTLRSKVGKLPERSSGSSPAATGTTFRLPPTGVQRALRDVSKVSKVSKSCRYVVMANFATLRCKVRGCSAIFCSVKRSKRPTDLRMLARRAQQQHFVLLRKTWPLRGLELLRRPPSRYLLIEPIGRPAEHEQAQGRAKLGRLEGPSVLSLRSKPTGLRPVYGNNTGRRRGPLSKRSKQQGLACKTKHGLNKTCINQRCCFATSFGCYANFCDAKVAQRLRQPFTAWGFVRDTIDCRTEVFGCRRQPIRGQSERNTGQGPQGLGNIVTKARYKTIRPLLNLSRDNLATLCKDLRLPVYPDKSNKAVQYSRNRLREQILPAVKLFLNPKIDNALFKLAELLTQDFSVISHLVNTGRPLK